MRTSVSSIASPLGRGRPRGEMTGRRVDAFEAPAVMSYVQRTTLGHVTVRRTDSFQRRLPRGYPAPPRSLRRKAVEHSPRIDRRVEPPRRRRLPGQPKAQQRAERASGARLIVIGHRREAGFRAASSACRRWAR
jgi:hypothetical protein